MTDFEFTGWFFGGVFTDFSCKQNYLYFSGGVKSKLPSSSNLEKSHSGQLRLARTISREPQVKESSVDDDDDDDFNDGQVSAV